MRARSRPAQFRLPSLCRLLLVAIASTLLGACAEPAPPARRNLVLILVDTLRRDHVGAYGAEHPTPNIDALAARGQVFRKVLASFHQTSMSMGAIFTGRTPSIESGDPRETLPWNSSTWCGMARFATPDGADTCLPRALVTLPERLRAAGFWTIGVVSNQFLYEPSGFGRGFEDWTEIDERTATTGAASRRGIAKPHESRTWPHVNRAAFAALDRRVSDRPFFLYVHYLDVHDYRFHGLSYAEAVAVADHAIGDLLAGIAERGLTDSTTIVLASDHGERLGEDHALDFELPQIYGHYGNPSFEELLEVPLIIAPARFAEEETRRVLRTQDLHVWLQRAAGIPVKAAASSELRPGELYIGEMQFRTHRVGRWKVSLRRSDGKAYLYDLQNDPDERVDVSAKHPPRVLAHRNRTNELARELLIEVAPKNELSPEDADRLRSLGYLGD